MVPAALPSKLIGHLHLASLSLISSRTVAIHTEALALNHKLETLNTDGPGSRNKGCMALM